MFAAHDTTLPFTFDLPTDVPFAFSLTVLAEHLAPLVDQRKRRGKRYPLLPLLLTTVLAKLAGYPRLEDLSDWARLRAADLTALFGLSRSTMPHQATWSRVFAHAIDLAEFEARLTSFFQAQRQSAGLPERGSIVLALDRKTLRGTIPAGQSCGVHLPPTDFETVRSCESGHGRVEECIITVSNMLQDYTPWPYLAQVFKLERRWWDAKGEHHDNLLPILALAVPGVLLTTLMSAPSSAWGRDWSDERVHVSGVLAVVAAGIVCGTLGPRGMSPTTQIVLFNFWEYLAFVANSLVFLLIGLDVNIPQLAAQLGPIALAVGAVLLSRALVVYGLSAALNLRSEGPRVFSAGRVMRRRAPQPRTVAPGV